MGLLDVSAGEAIMAKLALLRAYKPPPDVERRILLASMLVLVAGVYFSLRDNPGILGQIDYRAIALVILIGVPLTALVNALEFVLSARMVGAGFPLLRSLRITIIGSAANMLPLPGSAMVRIVALKSSGVSFKRGTGITLFLALVWIGMAFFYAGVMLLQFDTGLVAWGLSLSGAVILFASAWVTRYSQARLLDYLQVVLLKLAMVLIDTGRIYLCFQALGLTVAIEQASVFVVSNVLGSAVSLVPAGLGVREVVSAGLAPIVGIAVSAGFLSATLNRIAGLAALLPVAGLLVWLDRDKQGQAQ